jgi:hypothetical protein
MQKTQPFDGYLGISPIRVPRPDARNRNRLRFFGHLDGVGHPLSAAHRREDAR